MKEELEKKDQQLINKGSSVASTFLKIVGSAAFLTVAAAVIVSLPDIKRYIKISNYVIGIPFFRNK